MKRRKFLVLAASAVALAPTGAAARDYVARVVSQLHAQGYREISISKTWLGRTRIVAVSRELRREIVMNARTGEILRDLWEPRNDLLETPDSSHGRGGQGSDGGRAGDDDDRDDEDGDDDGDDGDDDGGDDGDGDDGDGDDGDGGDGDGDDGDDD